jgi:hypothetical protein
LQGKTKNYGNDDPYPVIVEGMAKPISSTKIEEYVNYEFWYYYQFYNNSKRCGPPFPGGWIDWPAWIPQLLAAFDRILESNRRRNEYEFQAALHGKKLR